MVSSTERAASSIHSEHGSKSYSGGHVARTCFSGERTRLAIANFPLVSLHFPIVLQIGMNEAGTRGKHATQKLALLRVPVRRGLF
jgi:starvation-inducible outer membrane lipoprotein